ncbi:MAG: hypothetical protein D6703_00075 [Zetaproteobacteria bacterium]|nr:MAG: hypothetical protein D6703_00075 [Zetaproteobacteria bacterium]
MIESYCKEILRFRKALNLTAAEDVHTLMQRFVNPSLAMNVWIPKKGRLLDVGSGMGIPGVPLLLEEPGLHGLLVERRKKRAEFLRHIVRTFGLNAEVFDDDIRKLAPLEADVLVARAVAEQAWLLDACCRHVKPSGTAILIVPRQSSIARVRGWSHIGDCQIGAGEALLCIRRYQREPANREVSRET